MASLLCAGRTHHDANGNHRLCGDTAGWITDLYLPDSYSSNSFTHCTSGNSNSDSIANFSTTNALCDYATAGFLSG